jgi:hypothetical protein
VCYVVCKTLDLTNKLIDVMMDCHASNNLSAPLYLPALLRYHDVLGHHTARWVGIFAQVFVMLQLIGTGVAQAGPEIYCSRHFFPYADTFVS